MPVENSANNRKPRKKADKSAARLPGQFVSDELAEQTARFVETAKSLAQRRRERDASEPEGPPPPGDQRSRRL